MFNSWITILTTTSFVYCFIFVFIIIIIFRIKKKGEGKNYIEQSFMVLFMHTIAQNRMNWIMIGAEYIEIKSAFYVIATKQIDNATKAYVGAHKNVQFLNWRWISSNHKLWRPRSLYLTMMWYTDFIFERNLKIDAKIFNSVHKSQVLLHLRTNIVDNVN